MKKFQKNGEPKFNTDNMMKGWLGKFIDKVGTDDAQTLLRGVGDVVGDHQDVPNNYSTPLSYQNCVKKD